MTNLKLYMVWRKIAGRKQATRIMAVSAYMACWQAASATGLAISEFNAEEPRT